MPFLRSACTPSICIPFHVARSWRPYVTHSLACPQVAKETCGKQLLEVLDAIFALGVHPVSENELKRIDKVMKDLAIDSDVGMEVLSLVRETRGEGGEVGRSWRVVLMRGLLRQRAHAGEEGR